MENQAIGTFITEFNATDSDANNTLTYSLVDSNGSGGSPFFTLDPNGTLVSSVIFDYENNASSYSIRVRVSDQYEYSLDTNLTVNVINLLEDLDGDGIEDAYDTTSVIPYSRVTDGSLGVVSMNIDTDMNAQTDILKMLSAPIQFTGSHHRNFRQH